MIEKFTFDFSVGKKSGKLILVKSEGETRIHVALKILAYLLFYDPALQVEVDAGMHYKPDLLQRSEEKGIEVWIDCGQISLDKVENLVRKLRRPRIILLKETHSEMKRFKASILKHIPAASRIEFISFEQGFVERLSEAFVRNNHIALYPITETAIGVSLEEEYFESEVFREGGVFS